MDPNRRPFDSLYPHGFARVAVCVPRVRVADPAHNTDATSRSPGGPTTRDAVLAVFPELGLSAYSNEDLFHQDALLDAGDAGSRASSRPAGRSRPLLSSARRCASSRSCSTARS